MPKIEYAPPGTDPTSDESILRGPSLRGCFTVIMAIFGVVGIASMLINMYNGHAASKPEFGAPTNPAITTNTVSYTATERGDHPQKTYTSTATNTPSATNTGTRTPTDTPTTTNTPTETPTGTLPPTNTSTATTASTATPTSTKTPKPSRTPRPTKVASGGDNGSSGSTSGSGEATIVGTYNYGGPITLPMQPISQPIPPATMQPMNTIVPTVTP